MDESSTGTPRALALPIEGSPRRRYVAAAAAAAKDGDQPAPQEASTIPFEDDRQSGKATTTTTTTTSSSYYRSPIARGSKTFLWELCLGNLYKNPVATAHFDGLRGVACLTVMVWHFICAYFPGIAFGDPKFVQDYAYSSRWSTSLLGFFFNGGFCVDIFYALSGRVLLHSYMKTAKNSSLVSGMFRRILRLGVPFAVITLVAWQEGKWGWVQYGTQAAVYTRSHWLPAPTLGAGVSTLSWSQVKDFIDTMFTETNLPLYPFNPRNLWTIRTEWRGSLAVFSVGFLMKNLYSPCRWVLYPLIFHWYLVENGGALAPFIVGLFLCDVERNTPVFTYLTQSRTVLSQVLRWGLAAASGCAWVYAQANFSYYVVSTQVNADPQLAKAFRLWIVAGTLGCLVFVQLTPLMQRLLASTPSRFIGYISFCLYLVHGEVYNTFGAWLFLRLYDGGAGLAYLPTTGVVFVASILVTVLLAWLMTVCVDDPSVKLAKLLYQNCFCAYNEELWLHRQAKAALVRATTFWQHHVWDSPWLGPPLKTVLFTEFSAGSWLSNCKGKTDAAEGATTITTIITEGSSKT